MTAFPDATLTVSWPAFPRRPAPCEPITMGLPFAKGDLHDPSQLRLTTTSGEEVPLQAIPTARWPDGSVRWALLDFQARGASAGRTGEYVLHARERAGRAVESCVQIRPTASGIVVDTGTAHFRLEPGLVFPFVEVTSQDRHLLEADRSALKVVGPQGQVWPARIKRVSVELSGPLRTVVRLDGTIGPARRPHSELVARIEFFAGSSTTRLAVTIRNPRRARHPGGIWELGDAGSVYLRDLSLHLSLSTAADAVECAMEQEAELETVPLPLEVYQDSSGGEHWNSATHLNRHRRVGSTFRGYRMSAGTVRRNGLRATPAVIAEQGSSRLGLAVEHFWENFPKALEADATSMRLRLLPGQFADLFELQGGEQKTHRFVLILGNDELARDAVYWGRVPAIGSAAPQWYCGNGVVPYLSPAADHDTSGYGRLVNLAIEGEGSFARKREIIDEYGWRHFGDIYADHEAVFSADPPPVISHYNNQYDAVGGFACQFMRTGDVRWWRLMTDLARHVTDIDIYHTDADKAAYCHGLFWHTCHYVSAGTSTHRSYPGHPKVGGGGPANEHNYTTGLRLHWLLTGDPQSREAAIGLAQWVIDMDAGAKTVFRWLSAGDTGLASATASPDYHGPGRGAGHSILALLDGHRLTGERRYLAKAEALMRRCIHPADDIAARNLLDAERRWSYTVFLQTLGKYLDYKIELDEIDDQYAYAHAALLHYARWMAVHEYPYLDKPEILEYPTETWAAQDVRKSEVFLFAAAHTREAERDRFQERAVFFFDRAISMLSNAPTRSLARPLVLLLSNGFMYLGATDWSARPAPPPNTRGHFGQPLTFIPQKAIVKKRLIGTAAALAAILTIAASACLGVR